MNNYDDFEDLDDDELSTEVIKSFLESKEFIKKAFDNSYDIITKKITFKDLINNNIKTSNPITIIAHNIDEELTENILNGIIKYYEKNEEYEKCAVLHKMLTAKL